jgi:hypothetical protein
MLLIIQPFIDFYFLIYSAEKVLHVQNENKYDKLSWLEIKFCCAQCMFFLFSFTVPITEYESHVGPLEIFKLAVIHILNKNILRSFSTL